MMQMFIDLFERYNNYEIDMNRVVSDVISAMTFRF